MGTKLKARNYQVCVQVSQPGIESRLRPWRITEAKTNLRTSTGFPQADLGSGHHPAPASGKPAGSLTIEFGSIAIAMLKNSYNCMGERARVRMRVICSVQKQARCTCTAHARRLRSRQDHSSGLKVSLPGRFSPRPYKSSIKSL